VTAGGLLFIGATRDQRFRAFESRTGRELWSTRFAYNVTAVPITYLGRNGKQYVAVVAAANGQGNNESLHVFALPPVEPAPGGTRGALGDLLRKLEEATNGRRDVAPAGNQNQADIRVDGGDAEMAPWIRQVASAIRRNWFIPAAVVNTHTGRSVVRFSVAKDGKLATVGVVEPSGVSRFDRAAYNAIVAAAPFPPLPKTYSRKEAVITIRFLYNDRLPITGSAQSGRP